MSKPLARTLLVLVTANLAAFATGCNAAPGMSLKLTDTYFQPVSMSSSGQSSGPGIQDPPPAPPEHHPSRPHAT